MKNFFKKLWVILNDERNEKALVILLPCVALLVCALILAPQVAALARRNADMNAKDTVIETPAPTVQPAAASQDASPAVQSPLPSARPSQTPAPTASPGPSQTPAPTASPGPSQTPAPTASPRPSQTPVPAATKTQLKASSTEKDLYITVCGSDGKPISGHEFTLSVTYPGGATYNFDTETDGSCYLVKLEGGEYSVKMKAQSGYAAASAIKCSVKEQVEYEQIKDIEAVVEIKDVTEIPEDEMKPEDPASAPSDVVAEVIITPPEASGEGSVIVEEIPVLDANGNPTYTYTYSTGPNGYLLFRGSQQESNILPVDEDGDGVLDFGQYFVLPATPEEGSESELTAKGYYVSVALFNADNTPVSEYEINAEPVTQRVTTAVGWQNADGKMYYYDSQGQKVTGLKKIDGRIYYFDQNGVRAQSVGIDVSFYNKDINWQAVKAQGIDFAIIRLGGRTWRTGELYDDSMTQEYLREARAAGLRIGAYFYSTAVNNVEAVHEASVALNTLNGFSLDFPLFIDMEYSGIYPEGRADKLSAQTREDVINAFCQTVINSGYSAGVYSGQYFMQTALNFDHIDQYTIWLASYTSNNKLPAFEGKYNIWQFTDRGQINGISGNVDMNVIF